MYRLPEFTESDPVVHVQEYLRHVVAYLHGVPPLALMRRPEGVSVKPPGCSKLMPHLDPKREGTYQIVVALTHTAFLAFPKSHKKSDFAMPKAAGYYEVTKEEIQDLETTHDSRETLIPASPGDVCLMLGGRVVHGSPATAPEAGVRICTYCHYVPTDTVMRRLGVFTEPWTRCFC